MRLSFMLITLAIKHFVRVSAEEKYVRVNVDDAWKCVFVDLRNYPAFKQFNHLTITALEFSDEQWFAFAIVEGEEHRVLLPDVPATAANVRMMQLRSDHMFVTYDYSRFIYHVYIERKNRGSIASTNMFVGESLPSLGVPSYRVTVGDNSDRWHNFYDSETCKNLTSGNDFVNCDRLCHAVSTPESTNYCVCDHIWRTCQQVQKYAQVFLLSPFYVTKCFWFYDAYEGGYRLPNQPNIHGIGVVSYEEYFDGFRSGKYTHAYCIVSSRNLRQIQFYDERWGTRRDCERDRAATRMTLFPGVSTDSLPLEHWEVSTTTTRKTTAAIAVEGELEVTIEPVTVKQTTGTTTLLKSTPKYTRSTNHLFGICLQKSTVMPLLLGAVILDAVLVTTLLVMYYLSHQGSRMTIHRRRSYIETNETVAETATKSAY